jgi:hypothetical protein
MYKTIHDIDPNEIVTKDYLKQSFYEFEKRFDQKLDQKLDEKLGKVLKEFKDYTDEKVKEFERHTGALSEDFQHKLKDISELVLDNRDKVLYHDYLIRRHILGEKF